jgi:hypothetical protein
MVPANSMAAGWSGSNLQEYYVGKGASAVRRSWVAVGWKLISVMHARAECMQAQGDRVHMHWCWRSGDVQQICWVHPNGVIVPHAM